MRSKSWGARDRFGRLADEEVVLLFGLVRPPLVGRMPGYPVFVDPATVGRMPFKPSDWLLRGGPNPAAGVGAITADPVVRSRNLLQLSLQILKLVGGFDTREIRPRDGAAEALGQVEALADFHDQVPIRFCLSIHAVLDRASEQLV